MSPPPEDDPGHFGTPPHAMRGAARPDRGQAPDEPRRASAVDPTAFIWVIAGALGVGLVVLVLLALTGTFSP